ncbi:beta-galactosidase [Leucobacter exalbidus]|uniref:Beta-galactosidase n=1 Tax=Leucobacter exalbidus TaxID=662960 RepID=A0A940PLU4_9MICO|nr:beta-galactosidase family protein [Leucobacter exalbidus]MBP1326287.1 beta-galactosidase [Leucobacter exalbidus]
MTSSQRVDSDATDTEIVPAPTTGAILTWRDGQLYRNGQPHRILSGSMQYFRVHPDQWEDRLRRLVALGMNTVDTYVAWNFHERREGEVSFDGWRDIARYIELAGEVGLDVFLRPSPYICAEWSNGGLPHWLTGRARALRTTDPVYLNAVDTWWDQLIPRIEPLQAKHGGPIVAIQVENEYGSFGSDAGYMQHLRDGLRSRGITELLTTADGTMSDMQLNGAVEGAMPTFTFGSGVDRALALKAPEVPFMCSEMWGGWFDHWGENHHVRSADSMMGTINEILEIGGSFSLYMAHGGTNFGYWNGANHDRVIQPTVTSYDYHAPIGEDGTLNDRFDALRARLQELHAEPLPEPPANPRLQAAAVAKFAPAASLMQVIEAAPAEHASQLPLTFEEIGAEDGFVAYEATVAYAVDSVLSIDGLHDRATVLLDGAPLGVLERDGALSLELPESADAARLTILVESLGRINYGALTGEGKGIMHAVRIGRRIVHGFTHRVLGDEAPVAIAAAEATASGAATATLTVAEPLDAWLAFPGGVKGSVWLNGFMLGRYWEIGPSHTLYAPAPLWRAGDNEIVVFDANGLPATVEIRETPDFGPTEEFIGS